MVSIVLLLPYTFSPPPILALLYQDTSKSTSLINSNRVCTCVIRLALVPLSILYRHTTFVFGKYRLAHISCFSISLRYCAIGADVALSIAFTISARIREWLPSAATL